MRLGVLLFAVALALMLRSAFPIDAGVDYFSDASAAIDALAQGDLTTFFAQEPLMGAFSLLLRAPFVALVFDRSIDTVYFAGANAHPGPTIEMIGSQTAAIAERIGKA